MRNVPARLLARTGLLLMALTAPAAAESLTLYWHTGGPDQLRFYRRTFAQWQELGLDRHSAVADPLFPAAAAHDFRLPPNSPAFPLGFRPIDFAQAGLYGDAAWAGQVRHANCPPTQLPPPPAPSTLFR